MIDSLMGILSSSRIGHITTEADQYYISDRNNVDVFSWPDKKSVVNYMYLEYLEEKLKKKVSSKRLTS